MQFVIWAVYTILVRTVYVNFAQPLLAPIERKHKWLFLCVYTLLIGFSYESYILFPMAVISIQRFWFVLGGLADDFLEGRNRGHD